MNEIIIANNSLPQLCGCGLFAASESFIHTDRVPDFCVLIWDLATVKSSVSLMNFV